MIQTTLLIPNTWGTASNGFRIIGRQESADWADFVKFLEAESFNQCAKFYNQLICPSLFSGTSHRASDIISTNIFVLDADDKGLPYDAVHKKFPTLAHAVANSPSASEEKVKWHAFFPLKEPVTVEEYTRMAKAFQRHFDNRFDQSKLGASNLFTLPLTTVDGFRYFKSYDGEVLDGKRLAATIKAERPKFAEHRTVSDVVAIDKVAEMLDYVPLPDDSYADWINVGACLRNVYGDEAFGLWQLWTCEKSYEGSSKPRACTVNKWNKLPTNIDNIGTIINIAKRHGWKPAKEPTFEAFLKAYRSKK